MTGVTEAIDKTRVEADRVRHVSVDLARFTEQLSQAVESFLADVSNDVEERRKYIRSSSKDVVTLEHKGRSYSLTLHDRSDGGFSIVGVPRIIPEGATVTIHDGSGSAFSSKLVWRNNERAGFAITATEKSQQDAA